MVTSYRIVSQLCPAPPNAHTKNAIAGKIARLPRYLAFTWYLPRKKPVPAGRAWPAISRKARRSCRSTSPKAHRPIRFPYLVVPQSHPRLEIPLRSSPIPAHSPPQPPAQGGSHRQAVARGKLHPKPRDPQAPAPLAAFARTLFDASNSSAAPELPIAAGRANAPAQPQPSRAPLSGDAQNRPPRELRALPLSRPFAA